MDQKKWILFSGFLWLGVGVMLLYKGLRFISDATLSSDSICFHLKDLFGSPAQAGTGMIAVGMMIGFAKGRFVLSKTVARVVGKIKTLEAPIRLSKVYPPAYWILIGSMVVLGMILKILPIPVDARGLIDVAVGSALTNGAMLYFRAAQRLKTNVE